LPADRRGHNRLLPGGAFPSSGKSSGSLASERTGSDARSMIGFRFGKNPGTRRRFDVPAWPDGALRQRAARSQGADRIEIGLFARLFGGAVANLVALIEQLDLLEILEAFLKGDFRLVELNRQLVG
jgi:hypothetical protein